MLGLYTFPCYYSLAINKETVAVEIISVICAVLHDEIAERQKYTTGTLWERFLSEHSLIFVLVENSNLGEIP